MDKDPMERIRIKAKKFLNTEVFREDLERGFTRKGKHIFHRLSMDFDEALRIYDQLQHKVEESPYYQDIKIRNLQHPEDTQEFLFLYNAIFIAAPDPSRTITMEEASLFPEERTFIASLWQSMAGFIYLVIENDSLDSGEKVGAIAGIGVLPKYRGKRIGLLLIKYSIDYFKSQGGVKQLICEVYHENTASLKMFKGLGMEIIGDMILEEEQPRSMGEKNNE